ncbi:MAG TPA: SDR family oxidoreductase [Candidatus Acidoferrum sp.]|nr:SDR family oxidoreductase [Candidatus Acidoferrum sp.]
MTYLITGATGDVGSKVVERLLQRGDRPRVFVREEKKARSRFGDRVDVFVGDLAYAASLRAALEGVDALFLVNTGPQIPAQDEGAAQVAKAAGVKHLVKLSSMDVEQGLAIGAWHERGEAAIRASGIPFAFVQPTGFMSNLLAWAPSIKAEGVVRASTGDGRRAFIHSDDIAAVATKALTTREYDGESIPITGPEALSFAEVTARLGSAIGKPLTFQPISDEEARQRYAAGGASSLETEAHVSLWRAIREGRLANITDLVEHILGRKPIAMDQWAMENAAAFR